MNCKRKNLTSNRSVMSYFSSQPGHKSLQCRSKDKKNPKKKSNRWCSHCRSKTHNTEVCRNKDTVKTVSDDGKDASFAFKVTVYNFNSIRDNSLLVDTGATSYILNEKSKFLNLMTSLNPRTIA